MYPSCLFHEFMITFPGLSFFQEESWIDVGLQFSTVSRTIQARTTAVGIQVRIYKNIRLMCTRIYE